MTKAILDLFEQLHRDPELKSELDKILAQYPEEDILCEYCFDDQVKFIYEVILPFAEEHGFEFCLEDIVQGSGESTLDDKYLEQVAGGINFGRKLSVGTLAALQALTLMLPVDAANAAKGATKINDAMKSGVSYSSKVNKKDSDYDSIFEVLEKNSDNLHSISKEYPLNDVDGMIFATLSYLPMHCVPNLDSDLSEKEITISEWIGRILRYFEKSDEKLILHSEDEHNVQKYNPKNMREDDKHSIMRSRIKFIKLLLNCPRYKNIKVGNFRGKYSDVSNKDYEQFAAVTFTLEDGTKVVAYRGTDSTLSGWKEDLDLAWSKQVPAQKDALQYLEDVYSLNPNSNFVVTGHSKGGNLAVYSAFYMCAKDSKFSDRLKSILNYDGPGLRKDIVSDIDPKVFDKTSQKLKTFIPQSSVIGRIMNDMSKGRFICIYSSSSVVLNQHDSLSWKIHKDYENSDTKFMSYEIQPESEFMSDAISTFLDTVDKEKSMRIFVNWLFDFMNRNNISIGDERSPTEIFKEVFYNYFIRGKSLSEIVDTVLSPGKTIGISKEEQESFKQVMKSAFIGLATAYFSQHPEETGSTTNDGFAEKVVSAGQSLSKATSLLKFVISKVLSFDNIENFIKKLYS